MMQKIKKIISILLLISTVFAAMPVGTAAEQGSQDSVVVINDSLKTEESLSLFTHTFGCSPELKVVDGETVGLTMGGATSALGYPYMLFGDADWEDYILEFTSHDLWRVGGIVRSEGAVRNNDGYGGLVGLYETSYFNVMYGTYDSTAKKYSSAAIKAGKPAGVSFTHKGDMRFVIKVEGDKMVSSVTYVTPAGKSVTKTVSVSTAESGRTAGRLGLRAVFNQVNGDKSSGYFSDLRVTLIGDTATKYKEANKNNKVVIEDSLKTEQSLSIFTESFGCTPMLKEIDGEVVGVTMGGATSALGYPYMLFGEEDWQDYILEFTSHDLWRVSGILRSTDAFKNNDGYGGLLALYETSIFNAAYNTYNEETGKYGTTVIKTGNPTSASFTHKREMRFIVKVVGDKMTCTVRYTNDAGRLVYHTIDVNTAESGKTAGKLGLRAVFNQVNGTVSNGYFSDLKVTLLGESVQKYHVAIDDSLKSDESLSLFSESFGCTPELKVVDGKTVGVTMGGATSALGYPYMLFGEEGWEDYILEFTSHDLWRVSGIVRSTDAFKNNDGYNGLLALYETSMFNAAYNTHNQQTGKYGTTVIKTGDPTSASFTYKGEMRFTVRVEGENMTCTVRYYNDQGTLVTHTVSVNTAESGKTAGKPGLRAVYNQVNGAVSDGYFSDLKVTLLGETAEKYQKENPTFRYVAIDETLKDEKVLEIFEGVGCTPALKTVDGEVVGVTMDGATSALGYPYMLFGEEDWEDYILEFTSHDLWRVGGIMRSQNATGHNDGYGGILGAYETSTLLGLYSSYDGSTYISPTLKKGDKPNAAFTYKGDMRFVIKVAGEKMTCTVSYTDDAGAPISHTIDVNTAESGKSAGKLGLRAVYNQVNGAVSSGYFSDLKVTLLGETARKYKEAHDPDVYPDITLNPGTGDYTGYIVIVAGVAAMGALIVLVLEKKTVRRGNIS